MMDTSSLNENPDELGGLQKLDTKRLIFIFTVMFFSFFSINQIGKFLLVEFFLFVVFFFHLLEGKIAEATKRLKPFIGLLMLALVSQIFVDISSGTSPTSMLKGFCLILFTLTNLYGISLLTKFRLMEIRVALLGYSIGGLAGFFLQPTTYARSEIWKFGVGYPATLTVLVLISLPLLRKYRFLQMISLAIFCAVSLTLGARSLALLTLLPLFFLQHEKSKKRHQKESRISKTLLVISIVIFVFYSVYSNLAESGSLGIQAQSKYLAQTTSGGNIIINSRSELIFAAGGIADSPFFGQGSYAAMSPELKLKILDFLERAGIQYDMASLNRTYGDRIPVHSMLLQWWLWFGAIGMLFPLTLFFLYVKSLKVRNREPVFYYLALSGIWNVFFSPYGENYRILVPLTIVMLLNLQKTPQLK